MNAASAVSPLLISPLASPRLPTPPRVKLKELDGAEKLLTDALKRSRKALGNTDPVTLTSINNLGSTLHSKVSRRSKPWTSCLLPLLLAPAESTF